MDRPTLARAVLALGIAFGILAEVLLYGADLGLNVPLVTLGFLAAAVLVRPVGARFDRLDTWLPGGAIVLSAFVALRTDESLVLLDALITFALLAATIPALAGKPVTRSTAEAILAMAAVVVGYVVAGAVTALAAVRRGLGLGAVRGASNRSLPVVRGLVLALPILVMFGMLFASADVVFGRWVETALAIEVDIGDLPDRASFVLVAAWFAAGALWFTAGGHEIQSPALELASLGAASAVGEQTGEQTGERPRSDGLGLPEALVILVAVDVLFGLFVVLQVVYLFGGLDTRSAIGVTYAEYARRGFFELLFAAALAGTLVGGLEAVVARRTRTYVGAALVLVALTLVILASAVLRLRLYQVAYGWTELRFWALAGIVFVGLGLAATTVLVIRGRTDRLPHALAAAFLVVFVAVNGLGPAGFVADRNLERAFEPSLVPPAGERTLDAAHLVSLGDDAVPALVAALPRLPEPARTAVRRALVWRKLELDADRRLAGWPSWNLARERAREALSGLPD